MSKKQWQRPTITILKPDSEAEQPIQSERYHVIGTLGQGSWGTVYAAKDLVADDLVALKILTPTELAEEQMRQRGTTEGEITRKESRQLVTASHVVPRTLEVDDAGQQFIKMPVYQKTLADAINDNGPESRLSVDNGLTLNQATRYLEGIALGINEMQTRYGQIHPDLWSDNIVLDTDGRTLLTDLGSATVTTQDGEPRVRDNMGSMFTRAYECFEKDSRPTRESNSWALGAIAHRLFTGEYPHESGLENAIDPAKYIEDLDWRTANSIIWNKTGGKMPRPFRDFVTNCLRYEPEFRPKNGDELVKELNKAISKSRPGARAKRWGLTAAVLAGAVTIGGALWHADNSQQLTDDARRELEFEKRSQVVREYLGERSKPTWQIYADDGELTGWINKFGDENTGIATFLNTDLVCEAIRKAEGKTDWESIVPKIRELDDGFYADVTSCINGERMNNYMWDVQKERAQEVDALWAEANIKYDERLAEERRDKVNRSGIAGTGVHSAMLGRIDRHARQGVPPRELGDLSTTKPTTQPADNEHYNFTGQPPKKAN